ncbi:MAG: alpha/beta hydrolase fold domain-containing protein [Opitutales bacterium]
MFFVSICSVILRAQDEPLVFDFETIKFADVFTDSGAPVELFLDVYTPVTEAPPGGFPVVVWVHEGGWQIGSRKSLFKEALPWLIPEGIALVSVDYRLGPQSTFPKPLHDVKGAVRFLRAEIARGGLPFDADKVCLWGSSAGGHLSSLAAVTQNQPNFEGNVGGNLEFSSAVSGFCNYYGPTNIWAAQQRPAGTEVNLLGGTVAEEPIKAIFASPVFFVEPNCPAYLGVCGLLDEFVPEELYQEFEQKLISVGVQSPYQSVYINAGHGFQDKAFNPELWVDEDMRLLTVGFFKSAFNL